MSVVSPPDIQSGLRASNSGQSFEKMTAEEQILTKEELNHKSWKFIGYRGYSAFLSAETDYLVFRRFRQSSTRIALRLQDRVVILEEKLETLEYKHERKESEDKHNGSFRYDMIGERKELLDELKAALDEYWTFQPPQKHDVESIKTWHANHKEVAIEKEEWGYLEKYHDLFSLNPREKSPLRRLLDRWDAFRLHRFWRKETSNPSLPLYDKKTVVYISDKRVDRFVNVVVVVLGLIMLIGPIWILYGVPGAKEKLAIITVFVVVFMLLVGCATVAKIWEALAATAAYAAVLMVFMQLGSAQRV